MADEPAGVFCVFCGNPYSDGHHASCKLLLSEATRPPVQVILERDEAEELHRYMNHSYLDVNQWPALRRLLWRIDEALGMADRRLKAAEGHACRPH